MSSMNQKELRGCLNKFIASAKKEFGDDLTYKNMYSHVKVFLESIDDSPIAERPVERTVRKKSTRKVTTEPGDIFDGSLCHCRVWNKGFGKQCSNKPKEGGEVCGLHRNSIKKYGGWSLGMYHDKQPSTHLFNGAGSTKKGDILPWKDINEVNSKKKSSAVKVQDPRVMRLKDKFEQEFGKRPRGPKASDIDWLKMKLNITSDSESESSEESESESDTEMKSKVMDKQIDDTSSGEETEELSDVENEEEKEKEEKEEQEKKVIKCDGKEYNELKYDGVTYFKCTEIDSDNNSYEVLNDEEEVVGWYCEKDGMITFDDGYDEIHEEHEDYKP